MNLEEFYAHLEALAKYADGRWYLSDEYWFTDGFPDGNPDSLSLALRYSTGGDVYCPIAFVAGHIDHNFTPTESALKLWSMNFENAAAIVAASDDINDEHYSQEVRDKLLECVGL